MPDSFEKIIDAFVHTNALIIGDIMLDRYVYGRVDRISPEAPTAVLAASRPKDYLGGAANVAANIVGLSAACSIIGVVGTDENSSRVENLLLDTKIQPVLIADAGRDTTVKMRFVANLHDTHLLRADWESTKPIDSEIEDAVINAVKEHINSAKVVILSDYNKGVITRRVARFVIDAARSKSIPVIVDPKGSDYSKYRGATSITPNVSEIRFALGQSLPDEPNALSNAAKQLMNTIDCDFTLVTRSENGVLLVERDDASSSYPTTATKVVDVSGAGDTLVSCFALALSVGAEPKLAAQLANKAAGVGVAKAGTSLVLNHELRSVMLSRPYSASTSKIASDNMHLNEIVREWHKNGLSIGFTNGCFDLIHPGHIRILQEARANCDRLVVGLNSDQSVRRLKGPSRPLQDESARAVVLSALSCVDMVVLFDQDTPLKLIESISPNVLFKGADYSMDDVVGRDFVEQSGGKVVLIDLVPNNSTSSIVDKISLTAGFNPASSKAQPIESMQSFHALARLGCTASRWMGGEITPALFLDRDGVIINDKGYVGRVEDVNLLPNIALAIKKANDHRIPVVVISNQSGVARGFFSWGAVNDVDDRISQLLALEGARVDLTIYCGAGPNFDPLECRKPAPGMFRLAERMIRVDLLRSGMVGDRLRDLEAAAQAGVLTQVLTGTSYEEISSKNFASSGYHHCSEPAKAIEFVIDRISMGRQAPE